MPHASRWLTLSLCLALLSPLAVRLNAAPASPSTSAFLAALAGQPACGSSSETSSSVQGVPQNPSPTFRVIYPDCGYYCSDSACSGAYSSDPCYSDLGQWGRCVPNNTFCGEPQRSPCICRVTPVVP
jgi:hypothetical protein